MKEHQRDVKYSTSATRLKTELVDHAWTTGHTFDFTAATTLAKEDRQWTDPAVAAQKADYGVDIYLNEDQGLFSKSHIWRSTWSLSGDCKQSSTFAMTANQGRDPPMSRNVKRNSSCNVTDVKMKCHLTGRSPSSPDLVT
ncbi:hypothetical protein HPB47_018891 [Ixodes persulcatus]|uniref:Uncharacterized protein n=1 Tax=Ixodes persulcatus TaxID=34615 RepID=A0AC60QN58_IXOPE|nr:hypothetical protein HPB47_018891 [Ixodes persulcatus]